MKVDIIVIAYCFVFTKIVVNLVDLTSLKKNGHSIYVQKTRNGILDKLRDNINIINNKDGLKEDIGKKIKNNLEKFDNEVYLRLNNKKRKHHIVLYYIKQNILNRKNINKKNICCIKLKEKKNLILRKLECKIKMEVIHENANVKYLSSNYRTCDYNIFLNGNNINGDVAKNTNSFGLGNVLDYWYGDLSQKNIIELIFQDCNNFDSLFYLVNNIISVDFSNCDTSNVVNMNGLFYYSRNLKSLDLSNFKTSQLNDKTSQGMFTGCSRLEFINLTNYVDNNHDIFISIDKNVLPKLNVCNANLNNINNGYNAFNKIINLNINLCLVENVILGINFNETLITFKKEDNCLWNTKLIIGDNDQFSFQNFLSKNNIILRRSAEFKNFNFSKMIETETGTMEDCQYKKEGFNYFNLNCDLNI